MIETVDGCHKWLMRNAPAENVSVINRIFKYAVIKISNGMINDFKKLEDSQKEHTHLSNLFTRDTLMFNENMAMSYARMMNKFYCLDIKSSYLSSLMSLRNITTTENSRRILNGNSCHIRTE